MSDNESNGRDLTPYPDEAVTLALSVIVDGSSIRDACRAVGAKFGRRPNTHTVHVWTHRSETAFAKLRPEKKREWEALAGRVYEAWAYRALEAAEAKREDGSYVVSHAQVMVPFGIAKDGLRVVLDTINPKGFGGNTLQVQFNLVSQDGKRIREGEAGRVIEGEVVTDEGDGE